MKTSLVTLAIPFAVLALTGSTRTAKADDAAVGRPYVVKDQPVTTGPNRALLHSGIWILGLSYVPAVIVAAESNRGGDSRTLSDRVVFAFRVLADKAAILLRRTTNADS